ncbi:hypothetical protein WH47_10168 [Habropoda laboriosa]|uniref:Uncharacterized protein n=1 Tax=Habropoda laboriosa TaxID=597456 RepID=A0A0L7R4L9_9HYME|nr:hypothetical protein WH47_10168 [Habropoda laboriosa]
MSDNSDKRSNDKKGPVKVILYELLQEIKEFSRSSVTVVARRKYTAYKFYDTACNVDSRVRVEFDPIAIDNHSAKILRWIREAGPAERKGNGNRRDVDETEATTIESRRAATKKSNSVETNKSFLRYYPGDNSRHGLHDLKERSGYTCIRLEEIWKGPREAKKELALVFCTWWIE